MTKALPWLDRALNAITKGLREDHKTVTGEQVRFWLKSKRIKPPHTPHMYGILIKRAIDLEILKRTTETTAMQDPTSHGRKTTVYTVTKKKLVKNG